jgi:hypothetical protein
LRLRFFSELRIANFVLRNGRRDGHVSIALAARKVSVSDGIHISIMLEFGVIGSGYLGRALLPFIQEQPETTIVGVCDVVSAAAQSLGQELGLPLYVVSEDLLARARPRAVLVLTSHQTHHDLALLAA